MMSTHDSGASADSTTNVTHQGWLDLPSGVRLAGSELTYGELEDLRTLTHDQLLALEFEPQPWIVPGLLPAGLAVLVSAPKVGKTWLSMQLVYTLAAGGKWLHWDLPEGIGSRCYWMENDHQSLQGRFLKIQAEQPAGLPIVHTVGQFTGATLAERLANITTDIEQRLQDGFPLRLVVIDTLQLLQGLGRANDNAYKADVIALAELRKVALRFRICILALHHTNKSTCNYDDNDDPLMSVNGSNGIVGTANTIMIIQRPRGGDTGVLHVTGHQVGDQKIPMRFDKPLWTFDPNLDPDLAVTVGIENRVLAAIKAGADSLDQLHAALTGYKRQQITDALRELRDKSLVTQDQHGGIHPVRQFAPPASGAENPADPTPAPGPGAEQQPTANLGDRSGPPVSGYNTGDGKAAEPRPTPTPPDVSRETSRRIELKPCHRCGVKTAVVDEQGRPAHAGECPAWAVQNRGYQRPDWAPDDLSKGRVRAWNILLDRAAQRMNTPLIWHPYPQHDESLLPPPLRLMGKNLGTFVHEGKHDWKHPILAAGTMVTPLDKNAAYLAAIGSVLLPVGRCVHYDGRGPVDQLGIHHIDRWPNWDLADLPHPGGAPPKGRRAKEIWIGTDTLDLMTEWVERQHLEPFQVLESYTSPPLVPGKKPHIRLEKVGLALKQARSAAIAAGDDEMVKFTKGVYSVGVSTSGESTANTNLWRPDWTVKFRGCANANLFRAAHRARNYGLTVARVYGTDELHVAGNPFFEGSPFGTEEGLELNQWKIKPGEQAYAWR